MLREIISVFLTILTGLFFLIGIIICKHVKNKEKMSLFTVALAFIVMLGLIVLDLLPELWETHNFWYIIPFLVGISLIIILDKFIPHHHHHEDCKTKNEHNLHLNHIGVITIVALAIHNLLEGLTLYTVCLNNLKSGILMMISISLHNIPLGFQIGNSLIEKKNSIFLLLFLCLSSFLGALNIIIFGNLSEVLTNTFLALTLGLLIYILVFELFSEIKQSFKQKEVIYGIILGVIILIVTFMI